MRRLVPPYIPQIPILTPVTGGTPRTGLAAVVTPDEAVDRYAAALHEHGWDALAVTTEPDDTPPATGHFPYAGRLRFSGDLTSTAATLTSLDVQAVLAGSPSAMSLTDQLAALLALPGNDPALEHCRNDIAETACALRSAALSAPLTIRAHNLQTALPWAVFSQVPEVMLQHPDPAYADAGVPCRSVEDLQAAWTQLEETGPPTDAHVLQERPPGMVYHVDTVTVPSLDVASEHRVTALWAQIQSGSSSVRRFDLVRDDTLLARSLTRYLQQALTAVGIRFGPARSRVAFLPRRGPVLLSVVPGPHPDIAVHTQRNVVGDAAAQTAHLAAAHRPVSLAGFDGIPQTVVKVRLNQCPAALVAAAQTLPTRAAAESLQPGPGPAWLLLAAEDAAAIDRDVAVLMAAAPQS